MAAHGGGIAAAPVWRWPTIRQLLCACSSPSRLPKAPLPPPPPRRSVDDVTPDGNKQTEEKEPCGASAAPTTRLFPVAHGHGFLVDDAPRPARCYRRLAVRRRSWRRRRRPPPTATAKGGGGGVGVVRIPNGSHPPACPCGRRRCPQTGSRLPQTDGSGDDSGSAPYAAPQPPPLRARGRAAAAATAVAAAAAAGGRRLPPRVPSALTVLPAGETSRGRGG